MSSLSQPPQLSHSALVAHLILVNWQTFPFLISLLFCPDPTHTWTPGGGLRSETGGFLQLPKVALFSLLFPLVGSWVSSGG